MAEGISITTNKRPFGLLGEALTPSPNKQYSEVS